jgi:thiol-disulfide isomerase/thioredoxin
MRGAAILLLVCAACRTSEIGSDGPAPKHDPPAATQAAPGAPAAPVAVSVPGIGVKDRGIELAPAPDGAVAAVVLAARAEARKKHRTLLVYIGATWCEPCRRFHRAAERGELDDKFPSLSLLVFDLDRDGDRLRAASYAPGYVPYFGLPGEDGKATGHAMEGSIKGEGAVDNITPRLERLLAEASRE